MNKCSLSLIDKYLTSKLDWNHTIAPLEFMTRLQQEMKPEMAWEEAMAFWIESHIGQTNDHWLDFLWDQYKVSTQQQTLAA